MNIKKEIKKDEELLIKVFKLEKFIRKYKKPLIAIFAIFIISLVGYQTYKYIKLQNLIKENNLLTKAIENGDIKELKNTKLYDLYLLQKEDYKDIKSPLLADIKAYKMSLNSINSLKEYINNPKYTLFKNIARVVLIRKLLEKNNTKEALIYYKEIPNSSEFKQIARFLVHYGIVK